MTDDLPVAERARHVEAVLDSKGFVHLPASGWPGATEEEIEAARRRVDQVVEYLSSRRPVQVVVHEDGSTTIYVQHVN